MSWSSATARKTCARVFMPVARSLASWSRSDCESGLPAFAFKEFTNSDADIVAAGSNLISPEGETGCVGFAVEEVEILLTDEGPGVVDLIGSWIGGRSIQLSAIEDSEKIKVSVVASCDQDLSVGQQRRRVTL